MKTKEICQWRDVGKGAAARSSRARPVLRSLLPWRKCAASRTNGPPAGSRHVARDPLDREGMPPKSPIALRACESAGDFNEKKAHGDRVLADLGPDERKLLAVFARHGRDGRAITTASLAAHAGFGLDRKRLSEALGKLAGRDLITEGGDDPFIGSPVAYRLVQPLPARGTEPHSTEAAERHAKR
jgi:hypothetical protein